jgi:hypothetical protein
MGAFMEANDYGKLLREHGLKAAGFLVAVVTTTVTFTWTAAELWREVKDRYQNFEERLAALEVRVRDEPAVIAQEFARRRAESAERPAVPDLQPERIYSPSTWTPSGGE